MSSQYDTPSALNRARAYSLISGQALVLSRYFSTSATYQALRLLTFQKASKLGKINFQGWKLSFPREEMFRSNRGKEADLC